MKNAKADPTKDFFVRMITKDISLEDCLLDLIDNCVDGARRTTEAVNGNRRYDGFQANLHISPDEFTIKDNCGGISISNAIDYAFRFGRHPDAPDDGEFSVGLYGIGMKRAIFKIGKMIEIHSSTTVEAFLCTISVDEWLANDAWEFDMDDASIKDDPGTTIQIRDLYKGIAKEFADTNFINGLIRTVARDYVRYIETGFTIVINGTTVKPLQYVVKSNEEFKPYRYNYDDEHVRVDIIAGMIEPPPDSNEPTDRRDTKYFGWFVFCNDRVVMAADKTGRTVWDDEGFSKWHPQYNGFMGMVLFRASDPWLLPWTTTKRDVDESAPVYRRAVKNMKVPSQLWIEYTNRRKANLEEAKKKEKDASSESFFNVPLNSTMKVPIVSEKPRIKIANILYQRPRSEVVKAATALGSSTMSYKDVGIKTFEYFLENEVDGEE